MFDAVVVGARCAGAATAMLLARQGHKVLMVDQATFPSDMRVSTHLIWHLGVDLLDQWGLLDTLRATNCPLLTRFSLDLGDIVLDGTAPGTRVGAAMAPRRIVLDQVLLDAARAAGAELREGIAFEDVLREGARVVGIRVRTPDGACEDIHARCIIGADGRTSPVARAVGAASYHEYPKEQGSLNTFAYFSGVTLERVEFLSRPERMAYAWLTNDDQVLAGYMVPGREERAARGDVEEHFYTEIGAMSPSLAAKLRAGRRESDWITAGINSFCREPAGPGWALVGDAGLTVDPITAAGITNALRDAQLLAEILHAGFSGAQPLDEALAGFKERRDAIAVPLHQFAQQMAALVPPTDEVIALFSALDGNQKQIDRYYGLFGQTVTPGDFFSPQSLQAIALESAALKG